MPISKKKVPIKLSKDEFRAILLRHVEQDVEKWEEGIQMFLDPEDAAFVEELRRKV